jgi:hypothetical protein
VFGTLLDSVGESTTSAWLGFIRLPAVIFWLIGGLAWWQAHPSFNLAAWLNDKSSTTVLALLLAAAALLIGSSVVMTQLSLPLLRLLEGYWPGWLGWLKTRLIARAIDRQRKWRDEWNRLDASRQRAATARPNLPGATPAPQVAAATAIRSKQAALDQRLHDFPADEQMAMPTFVGNVLRASETYPEERYGLGAIVVWPALWLVLPQDARHALGASRRSLDQSVTVLVALFLTLVWAPWSWLVLIPALLGPPLVYLLFVIPQAQGFAQQVRATFDVHRMLLYASLRVPVPADPDAELKAGAALTEYLWRGFLPVGFTFTPAQPSQE